MEHSEINTTDLPIFDRVISGIGIEKFNKIAKLNKRFVPWYESAPGEKRDKNYANSKFMKVFADYLDSASAAGVPKEDSYGLVHKVLSEIPYEFHTPEITVSFLGKAFKCAAEDSMKINGEDIVQLGSLMDAAIKGHSDHNIAYTYYLFSKLHLTTSQSVAIEKGLIEGDQIDEGTARFFRDIVKDLIPAQLNGDKLVNIFKLIGGNLPYTRYKYYEMFRDILVYVCPTSHSTPQEMIDNVLNEVSSGVNIEDILSRFFSQEQNQLHAGETKTEIVNHQEDIDRYFVIKPGILELAAIPYQTARTFEGGLSDLKSIAHASSRIWEDVGEGMWVYDPHLSIWYSLGGKTIRSDSSVRHEFVPYDVSNLSDKPILAHVHPHEYEKFLKYQIPQGLYPKEAEAAIVYLSAATPSVADYEAVINFKEDAKAPINPQSYIAHEYGYSRFRFPSDPEQIRSFLGDYKKIQDEVLQSYDWSTLDNDVDPTQICNKLIQALNTRLPKEFEIEHFPSSKY